MSSSPKSISSCSEDDNNELRRGPWTLEEDNLLIRFIAHHGEGRWNLLAKRSGKTLSLSLFLFLLSPSLSCSYSVLFPGLRRTGKSCRLRWLNYLKPDVKRGNLSAEEQLLILDLHSKWGNRWSKIAQHLPGRTDNEIKNYWRTRVQKQARHLNIDTDSDAFQQIIRCYWMPRLLQKIKESATSSPPPPPLPLPLPSSSAAAMVSQSSFDSQTSLMAVPPPATLVPLHTSGTTSNGLKQEDMNSGGNFMASSCNSSSYSSQVTQISGYPNYDNHSTFPKDWHDGHGGGMETWNWATTSAAAAGNSGYPVGQCHMAESNWTDNDFAGYMTNMDELWQF